MFDQEKFLHTPLGDAAGVLSITNTRTGTIFRLDPHDTVEAAIHMLKDNGFDARNTVSILIHAGVFDPYITWVDNVTATPAELCHHGWPAAGCSSCWPTTIQVEPIIPGAPVTTSPTVCVDCEGAKGPATFFFRDDPTQGMCHEDYFTFMADTQRTQDELHELNETLVAIELLPQTVSA